MNRTDSTLAVLIVFLCVGCEGAAHLAAPTYQIIGVAGESSSAPGHFAFIDSEHLRLNGNAVRRDFRPWEEFASENIVKLKIAEQTNTKTYDYKMLLGPKLGAPGATARGSLHHSDPCFYVEEGWAMAWGRYPMLCTNWVCAAAEGTTFAIEVVDSNTRRIYFLGGATGSTVRVNCGANTGTLTVVGTYIEIHADCVFPPTPYPAIPAAGPIHDFVSKIESIAADAGWTSTS